MLSRFANVFRISLKSVHEIAVVDAQLGRQATIPATEMNNQASLDPGGINYFSAGFSNNQSYGHHSNSQYENQSFHRVLFIKTHCIQNTSNLFPIARNKCHSKIYLKPMAHSTTHHCRSDEPIITYRHLGGAEKVAAGMCFKVRVESVTYEELKIKY